MSISDLFRTAFHNLWIRKLRTSLNLVGIVLSCVLLLSTLAATNGIKVAIERFVENSDEARQFHVMPDFDRSVVPPENEVAVIGEMSDRRRKRLREIREENWREKNQPKRYLISPPIIQQLRKVNGVADVAPQYHFQCDIVSEGERKSGVAKSCSTFDTNLVNRIIAGQGITDHSLDQLLIHEGVAYELGYRSDAQLEDLIGKKIELHFKSTENVFSIFGEDFFLRSVQEQTKWLAIVEHFLSGKPLEALSPSQQKLIREFTKSRQQKPKTDQKLQLIKKEFVVSGVFRRSDNDDVQNILSRYSGGYGDLLLHYSVFEDLLPQTVESAGAYDANVYVNEFTDLQPCVDKATELGLGTIAPTRSIERIFQAIEQSKLTVFGIVAIVLFIAAVGISNTMIISLIERTEEIGIMKAVGASNTNILWVILFEGIVTGLLGGIVAILVSLSVITVGNGILRSYVESRAALDLEGAVFLLSPWMVGLVIVISVGVTTLAGIWPAWRAARMDPVTAMGRS